MGVLPGWPMGFLRGRQRSLEFMLASLCEAPAGIFLARISAAPLELSQGKGWR
jgi:hypothetical protein